MPIVIWIGRLALGGAAVAGLQSVEDTSESLAKVAPWLALAGVAYLAAQAVRK